MNHLYKLVPVFIALILLGCMHGKDDLPTAPDMTNQAVHNDSNTHLWGYYDIALDETSGEFVVAPLRGVEFTCNVVNFLNGSPSGVGVNIINIDGEVITCRITLSHPFPGLDQYWGFDVMGVFIGEAGNTADWNSDLHYPGSGDQRLLNADGFTRWFNPTEFNGGLPLLAYTHGNLATPGYYAPATLMPYKYFTDTLGADEDLWMNLTDPGYTSRGVFTTGANSRQYVLEFPGSVGIQFNYAVVAHWEANVNDPDPPSSVDDFPQIANADEAVAVDFDNTESTLWWNSTDGGGGELIAEISVLDWWAVAPVSGAMEEYVIKLSSSMFSTPYTLSSTEMIPVDAGNHYYKYRAEATPDSLTGNDQTLWVVVEYPDYDYSNDFGIPNNASGPLQACFRFEFTILSESPVNDPPEITAGVEGPTPVTECDAEIYSVTAIDPDGDPLTYTWSIVADSNPDVFDITGEDETYSINWQAYGAGDWKVNCQVTDSINPPVTATPLVVTATPEANCCPYAPNAAYSYTLTPATQSGTQWAYFTPIIDYDSDENCIDMDFMHNTEDLMVVNGRDGLNQIGSVHPNLGTHGSNSTVYVTNVETMSIDVGMDNRIVYVEFDDSVLDSFGWERRLFPQKTDIVTGSDIAFHVFDTTTMSEIGTGFSVGARIQAIDIDEYETIWVIDVDNEMHCFEVSGSTYVENTGRNFDMDLNGSDMEGWVFDFVINFYNEAFYILTNGSMSGQLYRVECDGSFDSTIDGNDNPIVDFWDIECTDRADIMIDNFDSSGDILEGEQDAQIVCWAEIIPAGYTAEKVGCTRLDASLGNDIWYQYVGGTYVAYGCQAVAINGITDTIYTKDGGTFGNQRIGHRFYVPSGQWY